ncbi:hypothetical protein IFM89_030093 [Coptis chinensis]|uniref:Cobalamin-independent methionine synthase MetE N-terminal domain-containing protein n=1 Tax=Coptis chinensis TaxID=261450 RepID=A0A835H7M9_9MAGN|nr:hypothetical protein IFM89_030093 [Coptis chinensis]
MASHIGYPRMGPKRELKFALESFWDGKSSAEDLQKVSADLRSSIWKQMSSAGIKYIPSNTFSYYDQVLDTTALLGAVPSRYNWTGGEIGFDTYFSMARGNASVPAMEMTKWFDTNNHFIVPELGPDTTFTYASHKAVTEYKEAKAVCSLGLFYIDAYDSSFVVLNDDPMPKKASPTSSTPFVLDTPMSSLPFKSKVSRVSDYNIGSLPTFDFNQEKTAAVGPAPTLEAMKFQDLNVVGSVVSGLICLESDNEYEDGGQRKFSKETENISSDFGFGSLSPGFGDDAVLSERFSENEISEVYGNNEEENVPTEQVGNAMKQAHNKLVEADEGKNIRNEGKNIWEDEAMAKKTKRKEEKIRLAEEKKIKEGAEARKLQKEQQKSEKGKFALKSIVAEIDTKVVELGSIGVIFQANGNCNQAFFSANAAAAAQASRKSSPRDNIEVVLKAAAAAALKGSDHRRATHMSGRLDAQQKKLNLPILPTTTIGFFPQTADLRRDLGWMKIVCCLVEFSNYIVSVTVGSL